MGPSTHAYGGTRMGDNAETNVVNRWGFAHEAPNLGILGASVMGTSGAHNPTLTVQALAWRTAEYLVKNWKTSRAAESSRQVVQSKVVSLKSQSARHLDCRLTTGTVRLATFDCMHRLLTAAVHRRRTRPAQGLNRLCREGLPSTRSLYCCAGRSWIGALDVDVFSRSFSLFFGGRRIRFFWFHKHLHQPLRCAKDGPHPSCVPLYFC